MPLSSDELTSTSIDFVRSQIQQKLNYNTPYQATNGMVKNSVTDMDNFPYNRFYRGVYFADKPVVMEREAGWRERQNECYTPVLMKEDIYPENCFEAACSTVYPCYPQYLRKLADKKALEVMLNKKCVDFSP